MNFFKKNQIIIYVIALMIITAGYLNYSTNGSKDDLETTMQIESKDDTKIADIGDATLVNSNDLISESSKDEKDENTKVVVKTSETNNEVKKQNTDNNEDKAIIANSVQNSKTSPVKTFTW